MDLCKQAFNFLEGTDDEHQLLQFFRSLPDEDQCRLLGYLVGQKQRQAEGAQKMYRRKADTLGMSVSWYNTLKNPEALERKRTYDRERQRRLRVTNASLTAAGSEASSGTNAFRLGE